MKKILLILSLLSVTTLTYALSGQAYLERFMTYMEWSQNLPQQASPEFLTFIDSNTPLANKLREKWLYQLASQKDWVNFSLHYQNSQDINLQCFAQMANYSQGKIEEALKAAKELWLSSTSQPPACNNLFDLLVKSEQFDDQLITKRVVLALDKSNLPLARYLLKQYKVPKLKDERLLIGIYQNPIRITQLDFNELHGYFYLYGLKRMISSNMDQAIKYWQHVNTKKLLTEKQQQAFLAHLSLYKAMRNHDDTPLWLAKVKPAYYSDLLLDWQIRFALKRQQWDRVEHLVKNSPAKDQPCWQYWLARALEEQGKKEEAKTAYQSIAQTRHYYGFLAANHLNKKPAFENELAIENMAVLKPYQPFIDNIKALYNSKQETQASRLLNDFISELPKEDKSALIYWIATELQWHGKSVYLSNTEELNNQLSLRFPLIYPNLVKQYAKNYQVSPQLIYAIIRQESGFREDVVSPVGARGLMQLMPATATMVAKNEKIPYLDKAQLFSSEKNINLGTAYLKQLGKRFNKHPLLIAAAYNAGPSQVNYWLKNHPPKEIDLWIETLPWHETRNYLKNVIAFYTVYQFRMKEKPDLADFMMPL